MTVACLEKEECNSFLVKSKIEELFWDWLLTSRSAQEDLSRLVNLANTGKLKKSNLQTRSLREVSSPPRSPLRKAVRPPDELETPIPIFTPVEASPINLEISTVPVEHNLEIPPVLRARGVIDENSMRFALDELFAESSEVGFEQVGDWVGRALGISRFFAKPLMRKISMHYQKSEISPPPSPGSPPVKISRESFEAYWRVKKLSTRESTWNFFQIVCKGKNLEISAIDFREFIWAIVEEHPGLAFFAPAVDCHERYVDTVVGRIMFHVDRRQIGRVSYRDLKRSSVVNVWRDLDRINDINAIRAFFSYEHYYVIFCKFWELDTDRDGWIGKEEILKYDFHAIGERGADRLLKIYGVSCNHKEFFEQPTVLDEDVTMMELPTSFTKKIDYSLFVQFIQAQEDRSCDKSIDFFFRLADLTDSGFISLCDISYFYQEQRERLIFQGNEAPLVEDIFCQLTDMIRPENPGKFTVCDLRRSRKFAGNFFSVMFSLTKFLAFEHREAAQEGGDWDKFCEIEYVRLAMDDA